jgi:hypothetical protein
MDCRDKVQTIKAITNLRVFVPPDDIEEQQLGGRD